MSDAEEFQLPEWAQLIDQGGPRQRYVAATPMGEFTVHTHGGQVTSWVGHGRERLWTSETAEYAVGKAIRGGIPVIFPWFANGPGGERKPSHGLARLATWELAGWGTTDEPHDTMDLQFDLGEQDLDPSLRNTGDWPSGVRAHVQVEIGADALIIRLTLVNYTDEPVSCEAALHTYLAVADVEDAVIEGLDGVRFYDKVARREDVTDQPVPFGDEVDRIYETKEPVVLRDGTHSLRVGGELGSSAAGPRPAQTVVWNPGRDKGPGIADISDWRGFVCIEAAAIGVDALVIPPPGSGGGDVPFGFSTLTQTLTVLPTEQLR